MQRVEVQGRMGAATTDDQGNWEPVDCVDGGQETEKGKEACSSVGPLTCDLAAYRVGGTIEETGSFNEGTLDYGKKYSAADSTGTGGIKVTDGGREGATWRHTRTLAGVDAATSYVYL